MFDQLHISHAHLIQLEINCKQRSIDIFAGGHNNNVFLRTAATTFPIHNKTTTFCFQLEKSMFFSFAAGPTDRRARASGSDHPRELLRQGRSATMCNVSWIRTRNYLLDSIHPCEHAGLFRTPRKAAPGRFIAAPCWIRNLLANNFWKSSTLPALS